MYQRRQGRLGFLDLSNTRQKIPKFTSQQEKSVCSCAYRKAGQGVWDTERGVNYRTMENTGGLIITLMTSRWIRFSWPQFFNSFNSHLLSLGSDFSLTNYSQATMK